MMVMFGIGLNFNMIVFPAVNSNTEMDQGIRLISAVQNMAIKRRSELYRQLYSICRQTLLHRYYYYLMWLIWGAFEWMMMMEMCLILLLMHGHVWSCVMWKKKKNSTKFHMIELNM